MHDKLMWETSINKYTSKWANITIMLLTSLIKPKWQIRFNLTRVFVSNSKLRNNGRMNSSVWEGGSNVHKSKYYIYFKHWRGEKKERQTWQQRQFRNVLNRSDERATRTWSLGSVLRSCMMGRIWLQITSTFKNWQILEIMPAAQERISSSESLINFMNAGRNFVSTISCGNKAQISLMCEIVV